MRHKQPQARVHSLNVFLLVTVIVLSGLLTGCGQGRQEQSTPRAVVDAYIAGLNAQDSDALARLAPPGNDAAQDIAKRLKTYGGQDIRLSSASLTSDITPDVVTAKVTGQGRRGAYHEILSVTRCGSLWCAVLGQAPSNLPPAQTTRPT